MTLFTKEQAIKKIVDAISVKGDFVEFNDFYILEDDKNDILNGVCKETGAFMQTDVRKLAGVLEICRIDYGH